MAELNLTVDSTAAVGGVNRLETALESALVKAEALQRSLHMQFSMGKGHDATTAAMTKAERMMKAEATALKRAMKGLEVDIKATISTKHLIKDMRAIQRAITAYGPLKIYAIVETKGVAGAASAAKAAGEEIRKERAAKKEAKPAAAAVMDTVAAPAVAAASKGVGSNFVPGRDVDEVIGRYRREDQLWVDKTGSHRINDYNDAIRIAKERGGTVLPISGENRQWAVALESLEKVKYELDAIRSEPPKTSPGVVSAPADAKHGVYVARSLATGERKKGITDDIDQRMAEHNAGKGGKYTKRDGGPYVLERWSGLVYPDEASARVMEKKIQKSSSAMNKIPEVVREDADLRILKAYRDLAKGRGLSNVEIADIRDKAGVGQGEIARFLTARSQAGQAVMSLGDGSVSTKRVRGGAVELLGKKNLLARIDNVEDQIIEAEKRLSKPRTMQPQPVQPKVVEPQPPKLPVEPIPESTAESKAKADERMARAKLRDQAQQNLYTKKKKVEPEPTPAPTPEPKVIRRPSKRTISATPFAPSTEPGIVFDTAVKNLSKKETVASGRLFPFMGEAWNDPKYRSVTAPLNRLWGEIVNRTKDVEGGKHQRIPMLEKQLEAHWGKQTDVGKALALLQRAATEKTIEISRYPKVFNPESKPPDTDVHKVDALKRFLESKGVKVGEREAGSYGYQRDGIVASPTREQSLKQLQRMFRGQDIQQTGKGAYEIVTKGGARLPWQTVGDLPHQRVGQYTVGEGVKVLRGKGTQMITGYHEQAHWLEDTGLMRPQQAEALTKHLRQIGMASDAESRARFLGDTMFRRASGVRQDLPSKIERLVQSIESGKIFEKAPLFPKGGGIDANTRSYGMGQDEIPPYQKRLGSKHGFFESQKNDRRIWYDSQLELGRLMQLEQDQAVAAYGRAQRQIPYEYGGKRYSYTPDLEVVRSDGSRMVEEIKPSATKAGMMYGSIPKETAKVNAAIEYLKKAGIGYDIISEKEIGRDFMKQARATTPSYGMTEDEFLKRFAESKRGLKPEESVVRRAEPDYNALAEKTAQGYVAEQKAAEQKIRQTQGAQFVEMGGKENLTEGYNLLGEDFKKFQDQRRELADMLMRGGTARDLDEIERIFGDDKKFIKAYKKNLGEIAIMQKGRSKQALESEAYFASKGKLEENEYYKKQVLRKGGIGKAFNQQVDLLKRDGKTGEELFSGIKTAYDEAMRWRLLEDVNEKVKKQIEAGAKQGIVDGVGAGVEATQEKSRKAGQAATFKTAAEADAALAAQRGEQAKSVVPDKYKKKLDQYAERVADLEMMARTPGQRDVVKGLRTQLGSMQAGVIGTGGIEAYGAGLKKLGGEIDKTHKKIIALNGGMRGAGGGGAGAGGWGIMQKWSLYMSGIAATLFVLQQAISYMRALIGAGQEYEKILRTTAAAAGMTKKEMQGLDASFMNIMKSQGYSQKDLAEAATELMRLGLSYEDAQKKMGDVAKVAEATGMKPAEAARAVAQDVHGLTQAYLEQAELLDGTLAKATDKAGKSITVMLTKWYRSKEPDLIKFLEKLMNYIEANQPKIEKFLNAFMTGLTKIGELLGMVIDKAMSLTIALEKAFSNPAFGAIAGGVGAGLVGKWALGKTAAKLTAYGASEAVAGGLGATAAGAAMKTGAAAVGGAVAGVALPVTVAAGTIYALTKYAEAQREEEVSSAIGIKEPNARLNALMAIRDERVGEKYGIDMAEWPYPEELEKMREESANATDALSLLTQAIEATKTELDAFKARAKTLHDIRREVEPDGRSYMRFDDKELDALIKDMFSKGGFGENTYAKGLDAEIKLAKRQLDRLKATPGTEELQADYGKFIEQKEYEKWFTLSQRRMGGIREYSQVFGAPAATIQEQPQFAAPASRYDDIFKEAADKFSISVDLLKAVAWQESRYNPVAVSKAGAVGVMQIMPDTAKELGVTDRYDPRESIFGGAKYLSQQMNRFGGDTALALAAYNAGPGAVIRNGGIPPYKETQNYVQKIMGGVATAGTTDTFRPMIEKTVRNEVAQLGLPPKRAEELVQSRIFAEEQKLKAPTMSFYEQLFNMTGKTDEKYWDNELAKIKQESQTLGKQATPEQQAAFEYQAEWLQKERRRAPQVRALEGIEETTGVTPKALIDIRKERETEAYRTKINQEWVKGNQETIAKLEKAHAIEMLKLDMQGYAGRLKANEDFFSETGLMTKDFQSLEVKSLEDHIEILRKSGKYNEDELAKLYEYRMENLRRKFIEPAKQELEKLFGATGRMAPELKKMEALEIEDDVKKMQDKNLPEDQIEEYRWRRYLDLNAKVLESTDDVASGMQAAWLRYQATVEPLAKSVSDTWVNAAHSMESAFKEGFFDMMEANFDNLQETATNALKIIQRAMAATLFDMVKMPIMGAAKTGMDSLFKNIFGPSGATKTTPTTGDRLIPDFGVAKGGAFTPGGHYAFEKGGVVDRPTYFRFAKGKGLMGEAGPEAVMPLEKTAGGGLGVKALSEKHGPMIMPLKRMPDGDLGVQAQFAAGGVFGANETLQPNPQMEAAQQAAQPAAGSGGDVKVIINNHTGEKVEAKESRGPSGNRELEVMIGNALMKDGPASRALQQTYGLSRRGVMRG